MSRLAAFEVLQDVLWRKKALDDALGASRAYAALAGPDRAFAAYLARTALRRRGQIDDLIGSCVTDPLPRKARPVYDVLRVGVAQLLFSATADHAAVATTVDLCRTVGQVPFAKLVNAVMRRLQREGAARLARQDAAALNTPDWLRESWIAAYGRSAADAIAQAHMETPPVDLTVKSDAPGWAEKLGGTVVLAGTVRLPEASDVSALDGFSDGAWWVQDAAARLCIGTLGDVAGKRVFDLCAAPGGKTLELASMGAQVTALDISEKRLARLRENLARTGLAAATVCADTRTWTPDGPADIVVLDAPCSSTGTLRRHPDVAYLKTPEDISKLAAVQASLLDAAALLVQPGGVLLYITCSLQPEEGVGAVDAFLARTPAFVRKPLSAAEAGGLADAVTPAGDLRTLPCHLADAGGMDGFFAARLTRRA
jgi:16S rRNA (cytosine967-C5)-methyltransferase